MPRKHAPWKFQRKLKQQDIPSYEEIIEYAKDIDNFGGKLWLQALFIILYLTGARLNEVMRRMEKRDIAIIEKDGKNVMLVTLFNEKNKERKIKKIPINLDREGERDLALIFLKYADSVKDMSVPDDSQALLFKYSDRWAEKMLLKYCGINPHFLRHLRLTHLTTEFNFNEQELKIFAGWTDSRPAKNYIEMRWSDLLKKL
jgi:integrase